MFKKLSSRYTNLDPPKSPLLRGTLTLVPPLNKQGVYTQVLKALDVLNKTLPPEIYQRTSP